MFGRRFESAHLHKLQLITIQLDNLQTNIQTLLHTLLCRICNRTDSLSSEGLSVLLEISWHEIRINGKFRLVKLLVRTLCKRRQPGGRPLGCAARTGELEHAASVFAACGALPEYSQVIFCDLITAYEQEQTLVPEDVP